MAYSDFLIGVQELKEHLHEREWRVVDCRFDLARPEQGFEEYLQAHIPGAVYAHLDRDLAAPVTASTGRHPLPAPQDFARKLGELGVNPGTRVVVYDQAGGAIAARLWWMLLWVGHAHVRLLDGGFAAWQRHGLPTEGGAHQVEPQSYEGQPDPGMVVSTADIEAALAGGTPLPLVDARDEARFRGDSEPIDAVAGHVPGARNFPFSRNLTGQGTWRPPEELRAAWETVLGREGPESAKGSGRVPGSGWAVMCGSGVTACHLALSAALAGLPPPRLYAGSWSEWIRDPRRPIATRKDAGGG